MDRLHELMEQELKPTRYIRNSSYILPDPKETKGVLSPEPLARIIESHYPGSPKYTQIIWDKEGLIDETQGDFEAVLKKVTAKDGKREIAKAVKQYKATDTDLKGEMYHAVPTMQPKNFFKDLDWPNTLEYWLNGGTEKDHRLKMAFRSCIIPLPSDNPPRWQPLNAHQIWVTNSGTGKSTFNLIYGNNPVQELTAAGLFGSNAEGYKGQNAGVLQGSGMFMVDETSELTVKDQNATSLITLLLSYSELGTVTRAFKIPITCRGTKTLILNSNPQEKGTIVGAIHRFMNMMAGQDDKVRIGRRFGIILFGNDFKTVNLNEGIPIDELKFIQRQIHQSLIINRKTVYSILMHEYPFLNTPDAEKRAELNELAESITTMPYVSELLKGCALATPKVKMAALRCFLIDNLPLIVNKQQKDILHLWCDERDEYVSQVHALNLTSFREVLDHKIDTRNANTMKELLTAGYTQSQIAALTGISQQAVSKWSKKIQP